MFGREPSWHKGWAVAAAIAASVIVMRGTKLKGEWILVKDRREEDSNKWLLIKAGKPIKISARADDKSAISGRSMRAIAEANDAQWESNRPAASTQAKHRRTKV